MTLLLWMFRALREVPCYFKGNLHSWHTLSRSYLEPLEVQPMEAAILDRIIIKLPPKIETEISAPDLCIWCNNTGLIMNALCPFCKNEPKEKL